MKLNEPVSHSDPSGFNTLEQFSGTTNFNQWIYSSIAPYCRGKILEVGSGIGNISSQVIKTHNEVFLSDFRSEYCNVLQDALGKHPHILGIRQMDLVHPRFEELYLELLEQFDTVYSLNVVEHIQDHEQALSNCYKLLKPGGRVIILVPAYNCLFNNFDRELGHFRRYTAKSLNDLLTSQGFQLIHSKYFNSVGVVGWWLNGSMLGKHRIPAAQLRIYNKFVPLFRVVDRLLLHSVGLSVIGVGQKPGYFL